MVLPPNDDNTEKHFRNVSQLNYELGLNDLSMGMSSDYKIAVKYKSTFFILVSYSLNFFISLNEILVSSINL